MGSGCGLAPRNCYLARREPLQARRCYFACRVSTHGNVSVGVPERKDYKVIKRASTCTKDHLPFVWVSLLLSFVPTLFTGVSTYVQRTCL